MHPAQSSLSALDRRGNPTSNRLPSLMPTEQVYGAGVWSGRRDSNPRPPTWKAGALPAELLPRRPVFYPASCGGALRTVVDPGLPFRIDLFLPDRYRVLELVDQPLTGIERLSSVGRRHGDHYAHLPHLKRAGTMDDRQVQDRPATASLVREVLHLPDGHRAVGLVAQASAAVAPAGRARSILGCPTSSRGLANSTTRTFMAKSYRPPPPTPPRSGRSSPKPIGCRIPQQSADGIVAPHCSPTHQGNRDPIELTHDQLSGGSELVHNAQLGSRELAHAGHRAREDDSAVRRDKGDAIAHLRRARSRDDPLRRSQPTCGFGYDLRRHSQHVTRCARQAESLDAHGDQWGEGCNADDL